MALTDVTINLNLAQILGGDLDTRRTRVYVTTNVENKTLIETDTGETRLGDQKVDIDAGGFGYFTTWGVGADGNPASWQTYVVVEYTRIGAQTRETRTFGPYTITAADDGKQLAELEDEQAIPAEYQTAFTASMESIRDAAEAARDEAVDISNIEVDDDIVEALVLNTGGAGPKTSAALTASTAPRIGLRFPEFELVPCFICGDSYGEAGGSTDADTGSTFFDRFALRQRTKTATNVSVGGKRSDEILMNQVLTSWTPNTRGLVCIADVVLNDTTQYADNTNTPTTAGAFEAMLAYLSARYAAAVTDTGIQFGPGWSSGATSTIGSYADVSFEGDSCYLAFTAVTTSGGTFTVKNEAGATLATVTTGGYAQTFTKVAKITGLGSGAHSVRVALASGAGTFKGMWLPSTTPPLILWHKPGSRGYGAASDARIAAYLAACQTVADGFTNIIEVPVGAAWDANVHLGPSKHPNDAGNSYICDLAEAAVFAADLDFAQGLNRMSIASGYAASPYTPTTPAYHLTGATAPAQVTGLAATTAVQVSLSWNRATDGGATITGYLVERSPAGAGTWTTVTTTGPNTTSYLIESGLTAASSYDFRVSAINVVGTGAASATATATAGAAVTTYFADTFTRADSSTPGSTETGALAWSVTAGDVYSISSNKLVPTTISTNPPDCVVDAAVSDGTLQVTLTTNNYGGLVFRRNAGGTTGYVFYRDGSGAYFLKRRTSATAYTTITTIASPTGAAGDVLKVVLNGSSIKCYVNGTLVADATDATVTGTRHGLWTGGTPGGQQYDNISMTSSVAA